MIRETTLPGVGRKFVMQHRRDESLVAIVHHDGTRELFRAAGDDNERLLTLEDETARAVGAVLSGTYYQPAGDDDTATPVGGAVIDWVAVPDAAAGRPVGDVVADADVTVLAVQRGVETLASPDDDFVLDAEDVLVALGPRSAHDRLTTVIRE